MNKSDIDIHDLINNLVFAERSITKILDICASNMPILKSMDEIKLILAVAHSYASRTSAPTEWTPNMTITNFHTPSPLPHHIRGGKLATMQLNIEMEVNIVKENMRMKQEQEASLQRDEMKKNDPNMSKPINNEFNSNPDLIVDENLNKPHIIQTNTLITRKRTHCQSNNFETSSNSAIAVVSMNLSDSSSENSYE